MSNVQLSSAALERVAARRTFPLQTRTGVCRSLFGPIDHDELHREMKSKLREISERDQQRWNFNFEANSPLAGDYEWEESPVDATPDFYRDSGRTRAARTSSPSGSESELQERPAVAVDVPPGCEDRLADPEGSGTARPVQELNQENRADKLNSGSRGLRQVPCVRRKRTAARSDPSSTTHITDFFVKRRRPAAAEPKSTESAGCPHAPKSPIPMEQTPRKRIR